MKGLMKHLALTALAVMFCTVSLPARASQERPHCNVTSGSIPFKNIILRTGVDLTSGKILYDSGDYTIQYTCVVTGDGFGVYFFPTLYQASDFKNLISALRNLGIGMRMKITEMGSQPVTITWGDFKQSEWRKIFGKEMPLNTSQGATENPRYYFNYKRQATISLELFVDKIYPENSTVSSILTMPNFMYISSQTDLSDVRGTPLGASGFAIKILRPGLTAITEITPQVVSLGHFIKASEASLTRSGNFSVTVAQKNLPAPGQTFDLPLNITFGSGSLSVIDDTHLALKNAGDADDNGMQLSVKDIDHDNGLIKFNQETHMGQLTVTPLIATGKYTGHYAIEVSRRRNMEVKTGKFSGAIPVTITYY
ncbi:hypothetical protein KCG26_003317 [Salmonella enterica subsp. enterica serovar Oslo]|nr:hypothetical protein [Salmonella enterica subsp. enterica serovar Oslo]